MAKFRYGQINDDGGFQNGNQILNEAHSPNNLNVVDNREKVTTFLSSKTKATIVDKPKSNRIEENRGDILSSILKS